MNPRPELEPAPAAPPHRAVRRPALRWYGGKWRLAPWIIRHLPPHDAYVEPYLCSVRSAGSTGRYVHDLSQTGHQALAEVLHQVQGAVVLSGYRSDLYEALYGNWRRLDHPARDDRAKLRIESLWLNQAASQRLSQAPH